MAMHGAPSQKLLIILQALCHLNKEQRVAVLRRADTSLIRCICECALNILQGNIPVKLSQKNKLKRYKKVLRTLATPKKSINKKKNLIVQKGGGFLPLLLAPILGTLISNVISR